MDRVVVISNPVASQFTGGSHRDVMAELAKTLEVDAVWPGSIPEVTAATEEAVANGALIVVAMGGDGMVHHVAQGLIGTDTALGIIPAGTTNVAARLFDIPAKHSKAARLIGRDHDTTRIGTARVTLRRGEIETVHHAVFACGLGLDAEVVQVADADPYRKYRFGSLHYARSALGVGFKGFHSHKPHVDFVSGDRAMKGTAALIQFREIYTYFGKIALRFSDEVPDPMSALIMERLRRRRIPKILFSALSHRNLGDIAGFEVWSHLGSIEFDADPPVAVQADGESLGQADAGSVTWAPDSITVISGH
ncbi:MAG: diacylglycerol/lipid kinase family protein [Acidimicrobiia bacterium]